MNTIEQQTGWRRPYPQMICQKTDVLVKVTEYSFDINNKRFMDYAKRRGVAYLAGADKRLAFTGNHAATKDQFCSEFRYSEKGYRFTDQEMAFHWRVMLAAKGAMQDCWELFQTAEAQR